MRRDQLTDKEWVNYLNGGTLVDIEELLGPDPDEPECEHCNCWPDYTCCWCGEPPGEDT